MTTEMSPTAAARRDAILSLGLRTLRRRRIRRTAAHASLALAPAVAIVTVLSLSLSVRPGNTPSAPTPAAALSIAFVSDDPAVLDRWAVADAPPSTIAIDDDSLRTFLAEAGLPTGIARAGNRVFTDFEPTPLYTPQ